METGAFPNQQNGTTMHILIYVHPFAHMFLDAIRHGEGWTAKLLSFGPKCIVGD